MTADPVSRRLSLPTGLDYHVLEWGADDASLDHTVVLVHGFLDMAWGWAPMVRAGLAGRFHVVAPDMRGHGDSDRVGAGGYYHFFDYLADLHGLVELVGRARVSLVGHSMGGSIVSYYAGAYPARVHRLALLEGTGPPETPATMPERVTGWLDGWRRVRERTPRGLGSVEEAAARLRKSDPLLGEALSIELARRGTAPGPDGRLYFKHDPLHRTVGPYPFRVDASAQFWRRIACPVLLVEGDRSQFRHPPEEAERRHACFADRRHAVIEGAAHMMQRHRPEALATVLGEFLAPA
jgi:pimeloyl-ACP methyl ester carboxylesterase